MIEPLRRTPTIIKNLLIINGIFFLASYLFEKANLFDMYQTLGLYQPGSGLFRPWQFISSVFMHGSFMHLLTNMFALWMFGSVIEQMWGEKRFLIYYCVTAIGASLLYLGVNQIEIFTITQKLHQAGVSDALLSSLRNAPNLDIANSILNEVRLSDDIFQYIEKYYFMYHVPVVGASGAVFGILLAFGMLFPNSIIYLYFAIPIKAKWFVILYGLFELFAGISGVQSGIAHFAHLGGMLFGFILIKLWQKKMRYF